MVSEALGLVGVLVVAVATGAFDAPTGYVGPVPVGAEMHRVAIDGTDFIARYDGQVWLRPAEGSELCATG